MWDKAKRMKHKSEQKDYYGVCRRRSRSGPARSAVPPPAAVLARLLLRAHTSLSMSWGACAKQPRFSAYAIGTEEHYPRSSERNSGALRACGLSYAP